MSNEIATALKSAAKDSRAVYTRPIPETLRTEDFAHKTVGMRLLTCDEELQASKLGGFDVVKTRYEATKLAICEIDGQSVHNGEGVLDSFFERGGPKMRRLLVDGYSRMSAPSQEEQEAFFGGEKVKVE